MNEPRLTIKPQKFEKLTNIELKTIIIFQLLLSSECCIGQCNVVMFVRLMIRYK